MTHPLSHSHCIYANRRLAKNNRSRQNTSIVIAIDFVAQRMQLKTKIKLHGSILVTRWPRFRSKFDSICVIWLSCPAADLFVCRVKRTNIAKSCGLILFNAVSRKYTFIMSKIVSKNKIKKQPFGSTSAVIT